MGDGFGNLRDFARAAPRDLWLIYFLKYLESYSYFGLSYILILFLSDEFDLSDAEAGFVGISCYDWHRQHHQVDMSLS